MRDLRDCSGPWSGFWIQEFDRGTMKLRLVIDGERIFGGGADEIGEFSIAGNYWPRTEGVKLMKRYWSHTVEYNGSWDGSMISGQWRIRSRKGVYSDAGGFDLWPDSEEEAIDAFTAAADDRVSLPA